jgi:outer membrane protein assembly factor BamA
VAAPAVAQTVAPEPPPPGVESESETETEPSPVDPYARDPNAPVPRADRARGWAVRPRHGYNEAVAWAKHAGRRGAQFSLEMALAPIEGALRLDERFQLVKRVENLLYNDERSAGVVPSLSYVSGFGPVFGANAFHKDLFGDGERVALKVSYGGLYNQLYQLTVDLPSLIDGRFYFEGLARYEGKAELYFSGIGDPPSVDPMPGVLLDPRAGSVETRYAQRRGLGVLAAGRNFGWHGAHLRAGASFVYNVREFDALDADDDDLSTPDAYDTAALPAFDDGVDTLEITADATLDTRDAAGATGSGWVVDAFAGGAPSLDGNPYLHYGVEATWYRTLFRSRRVIVLRAMHEGVDGDETQIPFTELPRLGGPARLRGYRLDRFRDELAFVGTVEYRYPIHYYASGAFFFDVGTVAQTYRGLLDGDGWRPGGGAGIVVHTLHDVALRIDVSYGESFELFVTTDALAAFTGRTREL